MSDANSGAPTRAPGSTGKAALLKQSTYAAAGMFAAFEAISIHSILDGRPAMGALTGLLVMGGAILFLTWQLGSAEERRSHLSRIAFFASAVAVVCAVVLSGRFAQFRGVDPSTGPLMSTVLFLLFQLGWAVTHWLTLDRGAREQSRYVPAAIGTVILIGGGILTVGGDSPRPAEEESAAVFKNFATAEDFAFANETQRIGEESGSAFAHYHTGRMPLIGLSFDTKDWFGRERISDLVGIFETGAAVEGAHRIQAKPGYVIASVEVQADDHINAIRVEFAPYDGQFLEPTGWYWSDWVGSFEQFGPKTRLDGGTELVVGLRGASGMVLNSLSLLTARPTT